MKDDLLESAARALRESTDETVDASFTRARVMASLHQGKVKRRTRLAFVLPMAACLAAGTAWGAATGRLPAVFHAIGQMVSYTKAPAKSAPSDAKPAGPAKNAEAGPPTVAPAAPTPEVEAPSAALAPAPQAVPAPSARAVEPSSAPSAKPASSAAFADRDGDLYRLAHEAHFTSHDYARALAGWEAYLHAAPSGRMATEARFNRALCLLRLGREEEAKRALQPFALGVFGYRQSEAQALLDELSRPHAP
jgi:TolA-binding protein